MKAKRKPAARPRRPRPEAWLGLDLGGTGAKAGVFDREGRPLAITQRPYAAMVSEAGHAEIPIATIYSAAREAVREAARKSRARIAAMAVSSQGQTFVSLDARDRPLHAAILWYDSRAAAQAGRLSEALQGAGRPGVGAIATAPKILWLRENQPETMRWARRFLLLPEYISYSLTGEAVTDDNTALSTGLYVQDASGHDTHALTAANIEPHQLARIARPGEPIGLLKRAMADDWGLSPDTLLVTGTNDQYAGALGAGNCRPGILTETTGTCLALVTLTRELPPALPAGIFPGRFPIRDYHFLLAFSKTAGVVLQWFQREFAPELTLAELDTLAATVPPGGRGLTALPHFDGAISPRPDARVRGAVSGLALQHTRADIYRALLEAITFSLRENIAFLERSGFPIEVVRAIGGGAKSDVWLQMKADVTGRPVERPAITEAAVFGAAMLAAVGRGDFASIAESSAALYRAERVFAPDPAPRAAYDAAYQRHLALGRALYGAE